MNVLYSNTNIMLLAKLLIDTWGLVESVERARFLEKMDVRGVHLTSLVLSMVNDKFMREDADG